MDVRGMFRQAILSEYESYSILAKNPKSLEEWLIDKVIENEFNIEINKKT